MNIQSVSVIDLSEIRSQFPDFASEVDMDECANLYMDVTFGDANMTLVSMSRFVQFLTDMCNDDALTPELYDAMYDALQNIENVYVNLEN